MRNVHNILTRKPQSKTPIERPTWGQWG